MASDDFHHDGQFGLGWVVVRTVDVTPDALREALRRGAVYATTGPQARFRVRDGVVEVESDAARVRFYDARGQLKLEVAGGFARYEPTPQDTYVRVECLGRTAGRAWSGAFWVVEGAAAEAAP